MYLINIVYFRNKLWDRFILRRELVSIEPHVLNSDILLAVLDGVNTVITRNWVALKGTTANSYTRSCAAAQSSSVFVPTRNVHTTTLNTLGDHGDYQKVLAETTLNLVMMRQNLLKHYLSSDGTAFLL